METVAEPKSIEELISAYVDETRQVIAQIKTKQGRTVIAKIRRRGSSLILDDVVSIQPMFNSQTRQMNQVLGVEIMTFAIPEFVAISDVLHFVPYTQEKYSAPFDRHIQNMHRDYESALTGFRAQMSGLQVPH